MKTPLNNVSVKNNTSKRFVVGLLCISIALQALAFAIPGDTFTIIFRITGALTLVAALLMSLKHNITAKSSYGLAIAVVAGLLAIALAVTLSL